MRTARILRLFFSGKLFKSYSQTTHSNTSGTEGRHFSLKHCVAYAELFFRLVFATESYGARYGIAFVTYFNEQNKLIE